MRFFIGITVFLMGLVFLIACSTYIEPIPDTAPEVCVVGDQLPYVYHPDRLIGIVECIKILVHVDDMRREADGDIHIIVRVSPRDAAKYLNAGNAHQNGDLVIEPICVNAPTQTDAIQLCSQDPDPMKILPNVGDCIRVEGRLVEDTAHYNWREIHPLGRWTLSAECPSSSN